MENMLKQLIEGQAQLFNEIKAIRSEMATKQDLARIENDHGTKLTSLLDGYHQNAVILDRHSEQLDRIESKVGKHDLQISVLDKTKSNRRTVKVK